MMSRRDQITMSKEEIHSFLTEQKTAILTSNGRDGFPHPMPMWFAVDDDETVSFTTFRKSQKVKNIERDPRVAILVESGEEYALLKGVVIHSDAQIIDDLANTIDTILRIGGNDPMAKDVTEAEALRKAVRSTAEKRVVIRCPPKRIISWNHAKLGGVY